MKEDFFKLIDQYLHYLQNIKKYSPLTVKTYKAPLLDMLVQSELYEEDGRIILDITKYRIKISRQNNKTINKKLSTIRSFLGFLETKNIIITLTGANSVKAPQTLPKPLNTDKIYEALENADEKQKLIVLLIYSFGLRISELANLKLKDISDTHITVTGKGDKQRQIPSNRTVNELLKKYISQNSPKEFIFEKNSKKYTIRQLQYSVEKLFKKTGIKATPHQLRHSFATDLLNNGARINDISELLGHSSLKATGIYTKLNTNIKLKQYNTSHPLSKKK
jgi:integrase/recombinase XerC